MDLRVFVSVGAALGVLLVSVAVAWMLMRDVGFAAFLLVAGVLTLAGVAGVAAAMRRWEPARR